MQVVSWLTKKKFDSFLIAEQNVNTLLSNEQCNKLFRFYQNNFAYYLTRPDSELPSPIDGVQVYSTLSFTY